MILEINGFLFILAVYLLIGMSFSMCFWLVKGSLNLNHHPMLSWATTRFIIKWPYASLIMYQNKRMNMRAAKDK